MLEKNKLLGLGKIRDLIVGDIEKVKNGTITQVKYGSDFIDFRDRTRDILPADSDEYIKFNGNYPRVTEWSTRSEPWASDIVATNSDSMEKLLSIIDELLSMNAIKSLKSEKKFWVNEWYFATRYILNIFNSAQESIMVVESFLDGKFYDFLDEIEDTIKIQVITWNQKPMFWNLYNDCLRVSENFEAKINQESHDRYILVDNIKLFHLGGSLNTIGKKDFMIQEIESTDVRNERIIQIEQWWADAKKFE